MSTSPRYIAVIVVSLFAVASGQSSDSSHANMQRMEAKFEAMDAKFEAMDVKFDAMNAKFDHIDATVKRIETDAARMEGRIQGRLEVSQDKAGSSSSLHAPTLLLGFSLLLLTIF